MNQPPHDFDNNKFLNSLSPSSDLEKYFSVAEAEAAKNKAKRWFIILLITGLSLGGVVAVGVVKVINELGLNQKPDQPVFKIQKKEQ